MEESLRQQILTAFPQKTVDIRTYSPMALAFLGDAVYSLLIRTIVVSRGNRQAEKPYLLLRHLCLFLFFSGIFRFLFRIHTEIIIAGRIMLIYFFCAADCCVFNYVR